MCTPPLLVNFFFFSEMGFRHVAQAGFELLSSSDSPALASQSAGITAMSHLAWPFLVFLFVFHLISASFSHFLI